MSHIANDILLDAFADHHPDCQQYNYDDRFDFPTITDCICELAEKKEREELHQEMLMEVERGN